MIQLGTILWLAFAVTAGIGLFQVKYEVQALEDRLTHLHRQILRDQEAVHVLHAEWSYLNEPGRLAELARRHLAMAPLAANQLARFETLPERLPVPPLPPAPPSARPSSPRIVPTPNGVASPSGQPVLPTAVLVSTGTVQ